MRNYWRLSRAWRKNGSFGSLLLLAGLVQPLCHATEMASGKAYYVDCSAGGSDAGDGTTVGHPLRTLAIVNSQTFHPGDQLLFKRGTDCEGTFAPKGSGSGASPIRVATYGAGAKPKIHAVAGSDAALVLVNQEYWELASLDVSGGTHYGVHISGDDGVLHHIHLSQLTVHDVFDPKGEVKKKGSGLVVIEAGSAASSFDDVVVDGVIACRTNQWSGIFISGGDDKALTRNIAVRNSIVHDVQGDGIVLFRLRDGVIENSVAWRTGMQHTENIGTANAIWTWSCDKCTVQNNEAFLTDSPGIDGGAFDIDYWNTENEVRNNYGHDTQGYCVSVFAAFRVTKASEVDGNLCIRNGLSPRLAGKQGAIFLLTWQKGALDGVQIHDNTVYWDPSGAFPAIQSGDGLEIHGLSIEHNTIYSSALPFVLAGLPFSGSNNFFYMQRTKSTEGPATERGGAIESRAIGRGSIACWSACNYAGKRNLAEAERAWIAQLRRPSGEPAQVSKGSWVLYADLLADPEDRASEIVLLKSQCAQFRAAGLQVVAVSRGTTAELQLLDQDWQLAVDGVQLLLSTGERSGPSTLLLSPGQEVLQEWHGAPSAQSLGLALRQIVGEPVFAGMPAD